MDCACQTLQLYRIVLMLFSAVKRWCQKRALHRTLLHNCRVHIVAQWANRYIVAFHIAISRYRTLTYLRNCLGGECSQAAGVHNYITSHTKAPTTWSVDCVNQMLSEANTRQNTLWYILMLLGCRRWRDNLCLAYTVRLSPVDHSAVCTCLTNVYPPDVHSRQMWTVGVGPCACAMLT